jgi:hypothetical protein
VEFESLEEVTGTIIDWMERLEREMDELEKQFAER